MGKVVCDIAVSADGYSAGHDQTEERPFGDFDETLLHGWMFDRREENLPEVERITQAGAFIMGRNMFGPVRGEWSREWNGWWGPEPPYHGPVFVLTHYPREPLPMEGGTTFHFVTDGIESALAQAREAAGDADISITGGATTLNQYLAAGLVDELRLHVTAFTAGGGTRVFAGVPALKLEQIESRGTTGVTHVTYRVIN